MKVVKSLVAKFHEIESAVKSEDGRVNIKLLPEYKWKDVDFIYASGSPATFLETEHFLERRIFNGSSTRHAYSQRLFCDMHKNEGNYTFAKSLCGGCDLVFIHFSESGGAYLQGIEFDSSGWISPSNIKSVRASANVHSSGIYLEVTSIATSKSLLANFESAAKLISLENAKT